MVIRNRKLIGLISLMVGLAVILFWGGLVLKIAQLPFIGTMTQAKVIGYKSNNGGYGARMVQSQTSFKTLASGRSPFFSFLTSQGDTIKTYSDAPQVFILFNYEIGQQIKVAYPKNEPQKVVIVNWREFPGLIFMVIFGLLLIFVGKDYLLKKIASITS